MFWALWGPLGPLVLPWEPHGAPRVPIGPWGSPWALHGLPLGPHGAPKGQGTYTKTPDQPPEMAATSKS